MSKPFANQSAGTAPRKKAVGHEALTTEEKQVLSWSSDNVLLEFER